MLGQFLFLRWSKYQHSRERSQSRTYLDFLSFPTFYTRLQVQMLILRAFWKLLWLTFYHPLIIDIYRKFIWESSLTHSYKLTNLSYDQQWRLHANSVFSYRCSIMLTIFWSTLLHALSQIMSKMLQVQSH